MVKYMVIPVLLSIGMISSAYGNDAIIALFNQTCQLLEGVKSTAPGYIPRVYNKQLADMMRGVSVEDLIKLMDMAEEQDNVYVLNGVASVLVDHVTDDSSVAHVEEQLSSRAYGFVRKYRYLKERFPVTRACGDVEISVADYVSANDVPLFYLGNVGILLFDNKNLTSLYGLQDLSYTDVNIVSLAYNCILGSSQDPQFPNNAFQGLPNIVWLFLNDNKIEDLPGSFFDSIAGLDFLNLSNNQLITLPDGLFSALDQLGELNLSTNMLLTVSTYDNFANAQNLEVIDLSYNSLTELPDTLFANNTLLQEIALNNNQLSSWPSSLLNGLTESVDLDLSYNVLTSFEPNSLPDGSDVILTGNALTVSQEDFLVSSFPEVSFTF